MRSLIWELSFCNAAGELIASNGSSIGNISEENANTLNLAIRNKLYHDGISLVGYAYHGKKLFLRLLLAGHELTTNNIDRYFLSCSATLNQR